MLFYLLSINHRDIVSVFISVGMDEEHPSTRMQGLLWMMKSSEESPFSTT